MHLHARIVSLQASQGVSSTSGEIGNDVHLGAVDGLANGMETSGAGVVVRGSIQVPTMRIDNAELNFNKLLRKCSRRLNGGTRGLADLRGTLPESFLGGGGGGVSYRCAGIANG